MAVGRLAKKNLEPSTPVKLSLAICTVGLSFLALVAGMKVSGPTGLDAALFVILVYLINTLGELLLVPVSLSAMTQLSPAKLGGLMMGAWFLYSGMSNYVAALVARATGAQTVGGAIADSAPPRPIMRRFTAIRHGRQSPPERSCSRYPRCSND